MTENNVLIDKIKGQAYDRAAAMASEKTGCQSLKSNEVYE